MSALDDLTTVLLVACETQDRADAEQDALLRVAARVDAQANADVVTNRRTGPASRLYPYMETTRVLVDDQKPRLNAKTAEKLEAQARRWEAR